MAIACDPSAVAEAVADLEAAEYAPNTRTAISHRLALWTDICSAMGYCDPFALDPELIRKGAAVLRKARYRTAMAHVDQAVLHFRENDGELSQAMVRSI